MPEENQVMLREELRPYDQLLAAIIVQAAGDFCDAYTAGLIAEDNTVNTPALQEMIVVNRFKRCTFPKWMQSIDITTSVTFLFEGDTLENILPEDWNIGADALRDFILQKAKAGERISSYFVYESA